MFFVGSGSFLLFKFDNNAVLLSAVLLSTMLLFVASSAAIAAFCSAVFAAAMLLFPNAMLFSTFNHNAICFVYFRPKCNVWILSNVLHRE